MGIILYEHMTKMLKFHKLDPETHFNSILKFRGSSSMFVG